MKKRFFLLVCLGLLVMLLIPSVTAQQDGPSPIGERPDAPQYALHGPYWVGTQTIEMDTGTENALRFTIWYPALNPDGLAEAVTYVMSDNHDLRTDYGLSPDEPFTVLGHAIADATPDMSGAPYPLVINSHGFTAQMWQMYLGEHLASYGFVVIAPEHAHDSWDNPATGTVIRMLEINRMIDYAEGMTGQDGRFPSMIDIEHIAVGGHSAGGMASYGAAGAPLLWSGVEDYCQIAPDDAECANLEGQFQDINQLIGTGEGTPDELLPIISNSRVDAIFPMAGTMEFHGTEGLAAINTPMMTLFGSADPAAPWMYPAYEAEGSTQKVQVVFENAGHGIFYNQCEAFPYLLKYDLYWACSDPVWDLARTQDLTNHFVTAFLLAELYGDADAAAALSAENVQFPGITYAATGF